MAASLAAASLTMPPLPTSARPTSNCGFTRTTSHAPSVRQWKRWRQDLEQRNETHITCHCFDRRLKLCSRQRSGVHAFPGDDPGIRPQRGMELIAANIHSKYAGRSALQQNLCKTSG